MVKKSLKLSDFLYLEEERWRVSMEEEEESVEEEVLGDNKYKMKCERVCVCVSASNMEENFRSRRLGRERLR